MNSAERLSPPIDVPYHAIGDDGDMGYIIDAGEHDGRYYLIGPSENDDDEWKYPVDTCSDVEDAWGLRHHGNFNSDVDLGARIKRRANDLNCDAMPWEDSRDMKTNDCDCGCDGGHDTMTEDDMNMGIDALTVDAVRERNDNVDERIEKLKEQVREKEKDSEELDSIREALGVDADDSPVSAVESLQSDAEKFEEELNAYKESEVAELRESISDASEYEMDDLDEKDKEELSLIADALNHSFETDADADADADSDDESTVKVPTNDTTDTMTGGGSDNFDAVNYERQKP